MVKDEPLVLVYSPPLVAVLTWKEQEKGAPLTQSEVIKISDEAICIALPVTEAEALTAARGYGDINPENAWVEWQEYRKDEA